MKRYCILENLYFMTPKFFKVYAKQLVSLAILAILAFVIWQQGPHLIVAQQTPLQAPAKRLYIIFLLFVGWVLKFTIFTANKNIIPTHAEAQKKLQGRFQGIVDFLKKTVINKHGKNTTLAQLPWYFIIGPSGAGKTSLLTNAGVNYVLAKQTKNSTVITSEICDWWVTRDAVLVDIPGQWLASKHYLWQHLINLTKKWGGKRILQGIVIALNLPELMKEQSDPHKKSVIQDIKRSILALQEQWGVQIPVYLVATKCDLIPGFNEFFAECSSDELTQAWGFNLPPENDKILDTFTNRFNAIIKRLNKQLIWHLHQERNPLARPAIKDFPLHIERLKEAMSQLLKTLLTTEINLRGVYLTSSTQDAAIELNANLTPSHPHFNHQVQQLISSPPLPPRAYFIRQIILQALQTPPVRFASTPQATNTWRNRAIYTSALATMIGAAILLGRGFQQSVQQAYSIQNDLAQYQLAIQKKTEQQDPLVKALPLLNALQLAAIPDKQPSNLLAFYSNKAQLTAYKVYSQALQTIVLPQIKNYFEKYLKNADNKNPAQVYVVLKTYLMLDNPQTLHADYLARVLQQFLPTDIDATAVRTLSSHIVTVIKSMPKPPTLDTELIANTRKQLWNQTPAALALLILKNIGNNNVDAAINLGTQYHTLPVFTSKVVATEIPNMFTAAAFNSILTTEINRAAEEALQGNEVLGIQNHDKDTAAINNIATQLRNEYIANYIDIWESQLANLQMTTPKNLAEIDTLVTALTSNHSPLLQVLQTIKQNTSFTEVIAASPKLQTLSAMLGGTANQAGALYQTFIHLQQLHTYLQNILNSVDPGKATFAAAAQRMQNDAAVNPINQIHMAAEQSPEPIKTWLNTIATQSWHFILHQTASYIEDAWRSQIISLYRTQFSERYPFSPHATQEVDLPQFTAFLGKPGTFSNFYHTYLQPFVKESGKQWEWRSVDNQKIPFSDTALNQLENMTLIQQAFFPNGDNKLSVQFTLQPLALTGQTKGFILNVNGQEIIYRKNNQRTPRLVSWPGNTNNPTSLTTLNFISPEDQLLGDTAKGDWGWFRLVSNATRVVNSHKELLLSFSLNHYSADYLLFTQSKVNPFIPQNLDHLQLPEKLS
jgi:type VI secretion system protein ImpL